MKLKAMSLTLATILVSGLFSGSAFAHGEHGRGGKGEKRQAMAECAKAAGVELPEKGPKHAVMSNLTDEQRTKLRACMSEKGMGRGGGKHDHENKS